MVLDVVMVSVIMDIIVMVIVVSSVVVVILNFALLQHHHHIEVENIHNDMQYGLMSRLISSIYKTIFIIHFILIFHNKGGVPLSDSPQSSG